MKKIVSMIVLSLFASFACARFDWISSSSEFFDRVNKYPYALVGFVESRVDGKRDRDKSAQMKKLRKTMQAAAVTGNYKTWLKKEVGFFMLDASASFAQDLVAKYGLQEFPVFMLFEQGEPLSDGKGLLLLHEEASKLDMLDFVDMHFGKTLDQIVEDKKEIDRLEREERIARYHYYDRYYGWNPYRGWGPYSYRWNGYVCDGYACVQRYPRSYVSFGVAV